jgi:hypothetical protein
LLNELRADLSRLSFTERIGVIEYILLIRVRNKIRRLQKYNPIIKLVTVITSSSQPKLQRVQEIFQADNTDLLQEALNVVLLGLILSLILEVIF